MLWVGGAVLTGEGWIGDGGDRVAGWQGFEARVEQMSGMAAPTARKGGQTVAVRVTVPAPLFFQGFFFVNEVHYGE